MRMTILAAAALFLNIGPASGQQAAEIPSGPLKFAAFAARFAGDGSFTLEGPGWPAFKGTWTLLALHADTGAPAWKTMRDEIPSWGMPTVATTAGGPELVTNASNVIRGSDPATGKELWRPGGSSTITAPTPAFGDGLFVIASGRAPERPIFAVRPDARGDVTLPAGKSSGGAIAWSCTDVHIP